MRINRFECALALCGLSLSSAVVHGQGNDLNGHWAPDPHARKVPRADLVAQITADVLQGQADAEGYAVRWCNAVGMPAMMVDDDIDIRVSEKMMIISPEAYSYARYVYFGLPPRDPEILDPASVGYSDGRWENGTLVVDTYGFAGYNYDDPDAYEVRGLTSIPGGGFRTPSARVTERFSLSEDKQTLIVETTWRDPTVFASPHTYSLRYHRREPSYEPPLPLGCDPFDAERAEYLTADRASN